MSNARQADARTVPVALGDRSYDIHIGGGLLGRAGDFVPDLKNRKVFVLTDQNAAPYAKTLNKAVGGEMLTLPPGEKTKSFPSLEKVLSWMLDHNAARDSLLFTVGGGVIGDLGGFAAGIALRGIPYIQVPTTLLSQVDSAVGGKTAIDMKQGKNLVGVFHQPAGVICDIDTLATLPKREVLAGYAEIVKYGLIDDPEFFLWLEREGNKVIGLDPAAVARAVEISCRKKAEIVAADEREQGARALLNLGHTFAHALEAAAGYDGSLLHGEAVAIGMVLAFKLSVRLGLCPEKDADRVQAHLSSMGLPTAIGGRAAAPELLDYMKRDKKMAQGRLTFVLANGIGKAHTARDIDMRVVTEVLEDSAKGE